MSEMVYRWKDGARTAGIKAETAGAELNRIRKKAGGELLPADVVDESRPADAPLHPAFEWNNSKAAAAYREDQARALIRCVVVVAADGNEDGERAFVSVPSSDPEGGCVYVSTNEAMLDQDRREYVLGRALAEMEAFSRKYKRLTELAEVMAAIRKVRPRVKRAAISPQHVAA